MQYIFTQSIPKEPQVIYQITVCLGKTDLSRAIGYQLVIDTVKPQESKCLQGLQKLCDTCSPAPGPSYSEYSEAVEHPMMIFLKCIIRIDLPRSWQNSHVHYLIMECYDGRSQWKRGRQSNGTSKMYIYYSLEPNTMLGYGAKVADRTKVAHELERLFWRT